MLYYLESSRANFFRLFLSLSLGNQTIVIMIRYYFLFFCVFVLALSQPASAQHRLFVAGDSTAQT